MLAERRKEHSEAAGKKALKEAEVAKLKEKLDTHIKAIDASKKARKRLEEQS